MNRFAQDMEKKENDALRMKQRLLSLTIAGKDRKNI